jgi:cytochrome c oxidase subunit 3
MIFYGNFFNLQFFFRFNLLFLFSFVFYINITTQLRNKLVASHEQHPFHLVAPSPWPFITSMNILTLVLQIILFFNYDSYGAMSVTIFLLCFACSLYRWFADVITEAVFEGHHTFKVQENILLGMALFIVSEIMFFFSFFWAYFHYAISPSIWIGGFWPPGAIEPIYWGALPLLNTAILLASGVYLTMAHKTIIAGDSKATITYLVITILHGIVFTFFQGYEYINATFSMNDGVYGSIFYLTTGFHGIHVLVGTIFLIVCNIRLLNRTFFRYHHVGFVCAIWYWHFVDVVWIFLFFTIYIWGS